MFIFVVGVDRVCEVGEAVYVVEGCDGVSQCVVRCCSWSAVGGHVVRVAGTFGGIGVGRCGGPFVEVV